MSRLLRTAVLVAMALALLAGGSAAAGAQTIPDPPLSDADYFTAADQGGAERESSWDAHDGRYRTGARSIDTIANAGMLTVFATAAAHGHFGPGRNDARARVLVKRLTDSPPYYTESS